MAYETLENKMKKFNNREHQAPQDRIQRIKYHWTNFID